MSDPTHEVLRIFHSEVQRVGVAGAYATIHWALQQVPALTEEKRDGLWIALEHEVNQPARMPSRQWTTPPTREWLHSFTIITST